ncbi:MAG: serine hydrolase [Gemmatimonadota bacterium]|nr:serine hydrolase [Gemmatimonadota bacterium]
MRQILWGILIVSGWLAPAAAQETATPPAEPVSSAAVIRDFDAYVRDAMQAWKVPGLAIAVVRNDTVVLARGYGVRTIGKAEPVDDRTMFAIGSASKAFTAAAIGMLVDDGKLLFEDPATKYLPGFQLYDPYVTREITVRDLLTHRSGLVRGDLVWYGTSYDRAEIVRRVRHLEPTWSLRSTFGYQNIMYVAAGEVASHITRKPWDDVIRDRIFAPLGMTASLTSVVPLAKLPNVATPHAEIDDKVRAIPYRNIDNVAAAGSINSHVVDMARWVRLQLGNGKFDGKQLLSTSTAAELHTPQTIIRREGVWGLVHPESRFLSYGFGWFLADYKGRKLVHHGGNIDGMSALVAMLPEEKTGVVILTNMNGSFLTYALMYRLFDGYLGAEPKDWSTDLRKAMDSFEAVAEAVEKKREQQRVRGTKPSLALSKYAGVYADSMYGNVSVEFEDDDLVVRYGSALIGDLKHWHYDTFRADWREDHLGKAFVTFALGVDGKAAEMKVEALGDFGRVPERPDSVPQIAISEAELAKYAGTFESKAPPLTVEVQLMGGSLKAAMEGQPLYTLVPLSATRFQLTGPAGMPGGYYLDYKLEGDKVASVTLVQPDPQPRLTFAPKTGQ